MSEINHEEIQQKISFRESQEKEKLTLRKNKLFDKLFTKRKINSVTEEQNKSKYIINISSISKNQEIAANPELYIKTKFDIKNWFSFLFSKDNNQIKEALFLIELFVRKQNEELPMEQHVLSRNNYELINCLCQYLNHIDKQIAYYSCLIINNLAFFPYHIEKLIYTEKNLNEINLFFNNNDFEIGHEIICLLINCSSDLNAKKFFVDNKIIERITFLINNNLNQLETRHYIYIIRLLCSIIKLFQNCDEYNENKIKDWFKPLLTFFKSSLKNNYVNNPWAKKTDGEYYLRLLSFYSKLSLGDVKFIEDIIKDNFVQVFIEFYYKLNENNLCQMMEIFGELLSNDDSINQTFINEGILGLLINEINRIEYKNIYLLNLILFACSNIACGSQGQIEELFGQGLLWKAIDISYNYISQNIFNQEIKNVLFNSIYTLNEAIIGSSNEVRSEIMMYQDNLIIYIYYFFIKNILGEKNETKTLEQIGTAFYKLIICGESDLDKEILNKFRNKIISFGMEELINNILFNHDENKVIQYNFGMILQFLIEEDN